MKASKKKTTGCLCRSSETSLSCIAGVLLIMGVACSEGKGDKDTSSDPVRCPAAPPANGTECPLTGMSCRYDDPLIDYLCDNEMQWREREYRMPDSAAFDAGIDMEPAELVGCFSDEPFCPDSSQCMVGCCGGGAGAGCAACCYDAPCSAIPVEDCPAGRCELVRGCNGEVLCRRATGGAEPQCGRAGAVSAPCCEGLLETCFVTNPDGTCGEETGYDSVPFCIDCGDGVCEIGENPCNCPEDCGPE